LRRGYRVHQAPVPALIANYSRQYECQIPNTEEIMSLSNVNRNLATGIATGALLFVAQSVLAADGGNVQGVVSDASGKPVAGAFVKLKNDQKRLTFMVISREQGRFEAKDLPPGQYRVQGVGDNQSEWFSNVTVAPGALRS
jgi:hypothetical protein